MVHTTIPAIDLPYIESYSEKTAVDPVIIIHFNKPMNFDYVQLNYNCRLDYGENMKYARYHRQVFEVPQRFLQKSV